jgi:hypothetical protein
MKRPIQIPCPRTDWNATIDKPLSEVDTSSDHHPLVSFHAKRIMLTCKVEVKKNDSSRDSDRVNKNRSLLKSPSEGIQARMTGMPDWKNPIRLEHTQMPRSDGRERHIYLFPPTEPGGQYGCSFFLNQDQLIAAETDLHRGLLDKLKDFLIELGRDFCFVGSEYPLQVGDRDFALDLLFFHRGLNCLVAIELKVDRFEPEYLGKLNFYLEALDRNVRKAHEQPAIGVLLCASKNDEVVEYALSRSLSPALISEYQTQLPDKKLLQAKLHEFYLQNAPDEPGA